MSGFQNIFDRNLQGSPEYLSSIRSVDATRAATQSAFDALTLPKGSPTQSAQAALELLYEANRELSGAIRLLLGLPKDLDAMLQKQLPSDLPKDREHSSLRRAISRLRENAGVETYGQLVRMTRKELNQVDGLGDGSIQALEEHLRSICLQLDMQSGSGRL